MGVLKLTASTLEGSANPNGVFYGTDWRFYQARCGGLTISVDAGHVLKKATFTYTNKNNNGVIVGPDNAEYASDAPCTLSGQSAMFTIGGSDNKGQARITKIVVEYK
jgi:hypothetical protein